MLEDYSDLLTRKQAQELLRMGKSRILNYIHTGRLRALVLDGRHLIKKEDIVDFTARFNPGGSLHRGNLAGLQRFKP